MGLIRGVMKLSNVALFRDFLLKENFYMEEGTLEDGGVFFRTEQSIENGGSVLLVVAFTPEEHIVDLNAFNIAKITNPLKKESFLALINELNTDYRFTKFFESQGEICASYSMPITQNFDPEEIFNKLIMVYRCSADSFPKFMKLVWA